MKPSEFVAWFTGFTEAIDGLPSEGQWERIKKRVTEIDASDAKATFPFPPQTPRQWSDTYLQNKNGDEAKVQRAICRA